MSGTRRDKVDPELRARQAAGLPAQARANGWQNSPDPDDHHTHPDPDVRALIERHRREAAAEALREAADLGPLHFAATHTGRDARGWNVVEADWLRDRADALAGERP